MKILNYTALACVVLVVVSMFLPVYETWIEESKIKEQIGIGIYQIHKNGDTGFVVIRNGFSSYYALFNCLISFLLAIGIFFVPRESSIPIIAVVFYGFSLILLATGLYISAMVLNPFSDRMLIGFYLMLLSQTLLLIFSFYKCYKLNENDKYVEL